MRDIPTSPRIEELKHKHKMFVVRLVVFSLIGFILAIWGLSYLSFQEKVTINKIEIEGTNIVDSEKLSSFINEILSGKYLLLFSRKNSFIYPKNDIHDGLISEFPRIESLTISRYGFNTINIKIKERSGSYLYCGENVPDISNEVGENCFFLNEDGYIFDKAPYFSGNVYFKYYTKIDDKDDPLRAQVFNIDRFRELTEFVDNLSGIGFRPIYFSEGSDNIYYIHLDHKTGDTEPTIIFKKNSDLLKIFDNLSLSMKQYEFVKEINSKYNKLLYIDLKFNDKIFYKFSTNDVAALVK